MSIYSHPNYRWWKDPPPEHIMQDHESLLKYELSLIHRAYQEEAAPIIKQLAQIEMMKQPIPLIVHFDKLTLQQQDSFKQLAKRIKP